MKNSQWRSVVGLARRLRDELASLPGTLEHKERTAAHGLPVIRLITDEGLRRAVLGLFQGGHYTHAVEEAYKYVNNLVKRKAKVGNDLDGAKLMTTVFSPDHPILTLNRLSTRSEVDEQLGYMQILAGAMTGIRNPCAHENEWLTDPMEAAVLLVLADHLAKRVKRARRSADRVKN